MEQKEQATIEAELVDILNIVVDDSLPEQERIMDFLKQIKNPYHFRCGEFIVRVSFAEDGMRLEDCLKSILTKL